jgi:hypothetical protein
VLGHGFGKTIESPAQICERCFKGAQRRGDQSALRANAAKDEPLNQLVPLVEFSFDSPRGEKTVATMNPGLSYVAVSWQLAAEAIVPLNSEAGRSIGPGRSCFYFSMS